MLIKKMLDLQLQLNNSTNGEIWLDGKTKDGREINWNMCIYMEAVEALDSFNWKHWKDIDSSDDMDNIKVEIIDIWHFVMSEAIFQKEIDFLTQLKIGDAGFDRKKLIKSLEKLVSIASNYENIKIATTEFFKILSYAGMSINDLYKNYLVKNILNKFRQDNGYKNGTYIKNWDGVEDNVVAFGIVEKQTSISPDELYKELNDYYKTL